MAQNSSRIRPFDRKATLGRPGIALAFVGAMALAPAGLAQSATDPTGARRAPLPEAMLVPMRVGGRAVDGGSWILTYRNTLRGPEAPDQEVQSRYVTIRAPGGETVVEQVSWEILRTTNNDCGTAHEAPCPDLVRILTVPPGFMALPQEAWIAEGAGLRMFIVPAGIV